MASKKTTTATTSKAPVATSAPKGKHFEPKQYEKPGLAVDQINDVKITFDLFDTDGTGSIQIKELKAAMVSLGFEKQNESIFKMIAQIDEDGSGQIEFEEFLHLMTSKVSDRENREAFRKIFKLYDDQHVGFLSDKELRRVAKECGITDITEDEIKNMIAKADTDGDGLVSEEEFYQYMTKHSKK